MPPEAPRDSLDAPAGQQAPAQEQRTQEQQKHPEEDGATREEQRTEPDERGRWQRYLDERATRRDPRWPKGIPWSETHASGFRTPAKVCPRGCSHEVARRDLLTFTTWSGRVVARVFFDFESTNCQKCGSPRTDRCPRCKRKVVAPVTERCEFCGLPQPWAPARLEARRRTPPREWGPNAGDPARPIYADKKKNPKRQFLVIDDDITNIAVDAIVSNDDVDGQMYTVIASAIKEAAGQEVEDLSIEHGRSRPGQAWFTRPGRLNRLTGIIHVAAMDRRGETSIPVICDCVRSALDEAVKHDCASVAIGTFGIEPQNADREVIELGEWLDNVGPLVVEYLESLPKFKKLAVLIVLFEPEDFDGCVTRLLSACGTDP